MKDDYRLLSAETHFTWGNKKSKSGNYKAAITDYNEAIRLKPDFAYAYYARGCAQNKLGRIGEMKTDLQTAGKLAEQLGDVGLKVTIDQKLRLSRITLNPGQCGGRPCIRGMRIRVTDVLGLLASGLSSEEILEEMPDLEAEDIFACLQFAAHQTGISLVEIPDIII